MGALYRTSLVNRDQVGIRVHRLVQVVTRHQLGDQTAAWHNRALGLVQAAFPGRLWEPAHWPAAAAILPHAFRATDTTTDTTTDHDATVATIHGMVGQYLFGRAELVPARTALERALRVFVETLGVDPIPIPRALGVRLPRSTTADSVAVSFGDRLTDAHSRA